MVPWVYVVTSTSTSINFAFLYNPVLPIAWCHGCPPAGTAWVWDDSGKNPYSGQYIFRDLSARLAEASKPRHWIEQTPDPNQPGNPYLVQPQQTKLPSRRISKSSDTELQPPRFITARKCCGRDPVAAVIRMLTETEVKGTKCFTANKANVMMFHY